MVLEHGLGQILLKSVMKFFLGQDILVIKTSKKPYKSFIKNSKPKRVNLMSTGDSISMRPTY